MTKTIAGDEARIHFDEILLEAEGGERIAITRGGRLVAYLVPATEVSSDSAFDILEAHRQQLIAAGSALSVEQIVALKNEGRR